MLLVVLLAGACREEMREDASDTTAATEGSEYAPTQLLSAERLAQYKAAMPTFAYEKINEIIKDPNTLWYDKQVMVGAYQDSVGDGNVAPIGARRNNEGKGLINIIPRGPDIFSGDGKTWAFPFGHTAGTDKSQNIHVANFLHLPTNNGIVSPVVYYTISQSGALGGLGLHKWRWIYPKDAVLGEAIYIKDGEKLVCVELRTRTRYVSGWATNVFRPFPSAASLVSAIKAKRPDWQNNSTLTAAVSKLESTTNLVSLKLEPTRRLGQAFYDTFNQEGYTDTLPDLGDPQLVRELLTTTPFVSAYGVPWKKEGDKVAWAPTTTSTFSIVPQNYEAGLLEVSEKSCARCHQDAGRPVRHFNSDAILYGDIWGEDGIFSFHPWDQDRIRGAGSENRAVRSSFSQSGVVVRYDQSKHATEIYRELARTYPN
jgi:hypothetical protein